MEKSCATIGASTASSYTWYTSDASGNVMSMYNSTCVDANIPATLNLDERNTPGSSRLGVLSLTTDSKLLPGNTISSGYSVNLQRGFKFFEFSNHQGNVLATVFDKKLGHTIDGTTVDYYNADVITANDYNPGGMQMPGRKYSQIKLKVKNWRNC